MAIHSSHRRRGTLASLSVGALTSLFTLGAVTLSGGAAALAPVITHAPRVAVPHGIHQTWAASNWSGYAEAGTFTGVTGTWTVPSVSASSSATYSSAWIGVDGFNNSDLIQTGTEEDYYSGAAHYNAWWEILPAAETAIAHTVFAGDRMSASIYETSSTVSTGRGFRHSGSEHVWVITIADTTAGHTWSFTTDQGYTGPGTSAEWIMEAPEVGGKIATLAHYTVSPPTGSGDFDSAGYLKTVVSSGAPTYTSAGLNYANDSGVMIQNNVQVSTPGNPDTGLNAFNAAYGSSVPSQPTS